MRSSVQLGLLGRPRGALDRAQIADPGLVVAGGRARQRRQDRRQVAVEPGRDLARMRTLGLDAVGDDQLGLLAEHAAEAEPEIHRHPDHQRNIGLPQRF